MRLARMMEAYSAISSRKFTQKQSIRCAANWKNNTCTSYAASPASTGTTGHTFNAMMATIIVIIMAV
jgi:hypothetical protein